MIIHARLEDTAARLPDKEAVVCGGRALTFADLARHQNRRARSLRALGLCKSDRVAILLESSIEFVVAYWAVLKAGGISVLVQPGTSRNNLAFILDSTAASCAIVGADALRTASATFESAQA